MMNPLDTPPLDQAVSLASPVSTKFAFDVAAGDNATIHLLPFLSAPPKRGAAPFDALNDLANASKVFVVDENSTGRNVLVNRITSIGYSPLEFVSSLTFINSYALEPGCIVMVQRASGDGYADLLLERQRLEWSVEIIVLAVNATVDLAVRAMKLGAFHFYDIATVCDDELAGSIERATAAAEVHRERRDRYMEFKRATSCLSPSEHDVLKLVVCGIPNKLISKRLGISVRTVEDRRRRIYLKLRVDNAVQLVKFVLENDITRVYERDLL